MMLTLCKIVGTKKLYLEYVVIKILLIYMYIHMFIHILLYACGASNI